MQNSSLAAIKKRLMLNFSFILILNPVINILLLTTRINSREQIIKFAYIALPLFCVCGITVFVYYFIAAKLQKMIDQNSRDEATKQYAKKMPGRVSLLFCAPVLITTMVLSTIGYARGMLLSPYQLIFYYMKDILIAGSLTLFHYYRFKIILYPVSSALGLRSLSMFEKLLAPIFSFMAIVLMFIGFSIYSMNVDRTMDFYKEKIVIESGKSGLAIDQTFNSVITELKSYMNTVDAEKISSGEAFAMAQKLFKSRVNKNIDTI